MRTFALGQKDLGGLLMVSAFAYDVGALLFGDLAARRARRASGEITPPRALFGTATAMAFAGMTFLAFAPSVRFACACMAFGGIGRGALVTLFNSEMAARAPRAAVSTAAGLIASAQAGVHFAANPLVGHAVQSAGYRTILLALAAWTLPGCIAWMAWSPAGREREI